MATHEGKPFGGRRHLGPFTIWAVLGSDQGVHAGMLRHALPRLAQQGIPRARDSAIEVKREITRESAAHRGPETAHFRGVWFLLIS